MTYKWSIILQVTVQRTLQLNFSHYYCNYNTRFESKKERYRNLKYYINIKWSNRDSIFVIVTRSKELTSEKSWIESRQGKDVFLFSKESKSSS